MDGERRHERSVDSRMAAIVMSFADRAVLDPAKLYKRPADVLRDRRLTPVERVRVLEAWRPANQPQEADIAAALSEAREQAR
jgi:hypothetical protein